MTVSSRLIFGGGRAPAHDRARQRLTSGWPDGQVLAARAQPHGAPLVQNLVPTTVDRERPLMWNEVALAALDSPARTCDRSAPHLTRRVHHELELAALVLERQ